MTHHVHPWRKLRDLGPTWELAWSHNLPHDVYGYTDFHLRRIVLRAGMSFAERRCTVLHEVEHVRRGGACNAAEEHSINLHCARLLLPDLKQVMDAFVWHFGDHDRTADDLWVDSWTLDVRLSSLLPEERAYYLERLGDVLLS